MLKINMTQAKNIVVGLLSIVMALGLGSLQPFMLLIYAAICIFVFLTRTKFYYLPVISEVITVILFIINFLFTTGTPGSFVINNNVFTICMIVSIGCVLAYFVLNVLLMFGKLPEKKKANASGQRH